MTTAIAHFGGPDRPSGILRDLLAERIAAVPDGGAIDWVTYYFRDRRLAADLIAADRRGVRVRVTLEGFPRTPDANDAVIGLLREELADGLRVVRHPRDGMRFGKFLRPRLHEKLYCFSAPRPTALVGSFNPSADQPEQAPEIIREIGDHDRGHNVLVELWNREIVEALTRRARHLHSSGLGALSRFAPASNRSIISDGLSLHFWPRVLPHPIMAWLNRLDRGSRVRIAASHISGESSVKKLLGLVERGISVEILTEATHRRVPPAVHERLTAAGIPIRRVAYDEWLPMHNKFALVESGDERSVAFGSFNWSKQSSLYNRELGVIARNNPQLFAEFAERWELLDKPQIDPAREG